MSTEELDLIDSCVKAVGETGSKAALAKLYEIMFKPLYRHLMRAYKDPCEIEDVIMETFAVIIKKAPKLPFFRNCYRWIIRIGERRLANNLRKRGRRNEILNCIPLETHVKFNEAKAHLIIEIKRLSPYQQHLIFYKFYCKFKMDEIADMFKISRATVFRQINELLQILKEKLS